MIRTNQKIRRQAKQLFRLCVTNGELDEARVRQVVRKILHARRRGYLSLLKCFKRLMTLDALQRTADIQSAVPLPADVKTHVQDKLRRTYGATLATRFAENSALIGGMRIRVGSDVYDGSVQFRLATLEKNL